MGFSHCVKRFLIVFGEFYGEGKSSPVDTLAEEDVDRTGHIHAKDRGQFLLLYNRGAKIVAGMPTGFYEGYSEEIHEVFVYDIIGDD